MKISTFTSHSREQDHKKYTATLPARLSPYGGL
jgi:hypothetical protein